MCMIFNFRPAKYKTLVHLHWTERNGTRIFLNQDKKKKQHT